MVDRKSWRGNAIQREEREHGGADRNRLRERWSLRDDLLHLSSDDLTAQAFCSVPDLPTANTWFLPPS